MRQLFLALPFVIVVSSVSATEAVNRDFEAAQIKKLEIKNPKGEVIVIGSRGAKKISFTHEKIQFDSKCRFQQETGAGLLKLSVSHESGLFDKANCVSKIIVNVPSALGEIEVSTGSGHVKFAGVDSAVDFKTATGNVEIKGENLKSVSGKTATGNISLSYVNCPKRADIDLMTATGDTEVFLGPGCKIRTGYKSATGDLFNEIGDTEDYQVLLSMKSASGNLKVKKLIK